MSSIFESDMIWYIALPGSGRVFPQERTRTSSAICQDCRAPLRLGEGLRFQKAHFNKDIPWNNGYLCAACVGMQLRRVAGWHWNSTQGILFAATNHTVHRLDGARLADLFLQNGEAGLLQAIREKGKEIRHVNTFTG